MDAEQRRLFARDGYLVIQDALSPAHVAALDELVSARLRHELSADFVDGFGKFRMGPALQPGLRGDGIDDLQRTNGDHEHGTPLEYEPPVGWAKTLQQPIAGGIPGQRSAAPFRQLLELPRVAPVLGELLSEPRWGHVPVHVPIERRPEWRLDHDYCDVKPGYKDNGDDTPAGDGTLHGSLSAHHITCVFELRTVEPGDSPDLRASQAVTAPTSSGLWTRGSRTLSKPKYSSCAARETESGIRGSGCA